MNPIARKGIATAIAASVGFLTNAIFWNLAYGADIVRLLTRPEGLIVAILSALALPLIYRSERPILTMCLSAGVLAALYCIIWRYGFGSQGFLRTLQLMSLAYAIPAVIAYRLCAPQTV